MKLGRGHAINPAAIFNQIDRMGVGAIPVVVLMSAIVGAIVAQQGAYQLNYFGADIFVVDLVGMLILRELGVLMTAIMIAGRSGSAITAEIGSMKMREEVDALKVIGLNPIGVLVFPRLVALVIALPCLTIIANFAALGGGILAAWLYSGIRAVRVHRPPARRDRYQHHLRRADQGAVHGHDHRHHCFRRRHEGRRQRRIAGPARHRLGGEVDLRRHHPRWPFCHLLRSDRVLT